MIQNPYFDVFRRFGVFAIRVSFNIKCTFETSKANINSKINGTLQMVLDQMSVPLVLHVQNPNHPLITGKL